MTMTTDEKLTFIEKFLNPIVITYSRYSNMWCLSNRTDEGLGSDDAKKFIAPKLSEVVNIAYHFFNDGAPEAFLAKKKELEEIFGCRVEIMGNTFMLIYTKGDINDDEGQNKFIDKMREHPDHEYLDFEFQYE